MLDEKGRRYVRVRDVHDLHSSERANALAALELLLADMARTKLKRDYEGKLSK